MSVFRVKLQNPQQGYLDLNPSTATPISANNHSMLGSQMNPSIQRTVYVAGPRRTYRKLKDGDQFTDCNYWKRFAYPQVPLDQAFIEVVTDDGSVYSDDAAENTFGLTFGGDAAYTVDSADTFATHEIDIINDYGGYAKFVQLTNYGTASPGQDIKVQLNGSDSFVINLLAGDTQVFNSGDILVSKLAFQGSGASDTDIQVVLSVVVQCNS